MKALGLAIVILAITSSAAVAAPSSESCDLPGVQYMGELQSALSQRAVEVVQRAARPGAQSDVRLQQLVAPSAEFSLGVGDVGRPLGQGVRGATALATMMGADTFRYLGWNFIPTPVEAPCGPQKVDVQFTDTRGGNLYPVTFTFEKGRVIAAAGWTRTFVSGPIEPVGH
jgi:hypothetical protein